MSDSRPMSSRPRQSDPSNRQNPELPAWTGALARLLDDAFVIPGTNVRIGFDGLLGLIAPGAGDAVTAFVSALLVLEGFKRRVPSVVLLRMLVNLLVDAVIGAIPLAGDIFDVFYRANRKNLELLQRHGGLGPRKPALADYAVVGLALLCLLGLVLLPVVVGLGLIHFVARLGE